MNAGRLGGSALRAYGGARFGKFASRDAALCEVRNRDV
jgi:hypothetical protein